MKKIMLIPGICVLFIVSCGHKESMPVDPVPRVPQLTTTAISNITASTATSGGMILSNGGSAITVSGICWSKTSPVPTISDDTTKGSTASGSFVSLLTRLTSGGTYYVRAYAINSAGTGYGNVVNFSISNSAPEARGVNVTGMVKVAETLTAHYTYFDADNNDEFGTRYQWYIANDSTGSPVTPIAGATNTIYIIAAGDQNKFLRVGITPAAGFGTSPGTETWSAWVGPVGMPEPATLTFMYNGQTVTYGILTSQVTGRKWLDRNLGAPAAPTAYNDWANYGDLFQWGRKADGHQLVNRAASTLATTAVHGTTTTLSTTDDPGHFLFIITSVDPFDWRTPQNTDLWQSSGGVNNACPLGWHVPTRVEWEAENLGTVQDAYTKLKITLGGIRSFSDGAFSMTATDGLYWTSTIFQGTAAVPTSFFFSPLNGPAIRSLSYTGANGLSVRCIKN